MTDREYEYFIIKDKSCAEIINDSNEQELSWFDKLLLKKGRKNKKMRNVAGIPLVIFGYLLFANAIPFAVAAPMNENFLFIAIPAGTIGTTCVISGHVLHAKARKAKETGIISKVKTSKPGFYISFDF